MDSMARILITLLLLASTVSIGRIGSESSVSTLERICEKILQRVVDCHAEKIVLITDCSFAKYSDLSLAMINSLSRADILFLHYAIDKRTTNDDIRQMVRKHILDQNTDQTTFLLTTQRFDDVIDSAIHWASTDIAGQRGQLWFHNTRWMAVTYSVEDVQNFLSSQDYIPMDNVAFATIHRPCPPRDPNTVTAPTHFVRYHTLLWKSNRTRELELITSDSKPSKKPKHLCSVFPNILYHLNGRHFKVITKVHWGFFVFIEKNPTSGNPEYQGFLPDVLHVLASSLNFTFTLTPHPPSSDQQPSWDEVVHNVTSGEVDFSATLWSYSWVDVYNICITYPVILDTFTGVYRKPIPSDEYISLYILCPFNSITYLLLFASLIHTLIIYVLIVDVCYSGENDTKPRNPFSAERRKSKSKYLRRPLNKPIHRREKYNQVFFDRLRSLACSLASSILNQAYLPRPKQMSARLLLFLWSISMVMFYAIYTGSLTAEMVNSSDSDAIDSFSALVDGGKYRWGTTHDSIIDKVMKDQTTNGILLELNRNKQNIPDGINGDIYYTLKDELETLEDKFVLIHFKTLLNQIMGMMDKPDDYVMMKDSLLSANQGFMWRANSELGQVFSDQIRKMHDSGLIWQMYEKYAHGNRSVQPAQTTDVKTRRKTLTLDNVRWPLIIIALLVLLALFVLILEKLWHPVTSFTFSRRSES